MCKCVDKKKKNAHMVKPVTDSLTKKTGMRILIPDVLDGVIDISENKDIYLPLSSAYIGGRLRPYCKIYLRKMI